MAIEQAKKFGVDQFKNDPGLELRLRKIERELALRGATNIDSSQTRLLPAAQTPPAPSGLSLIAGLQDIAVKWNAVDIGNLKHYEVQIDIDTNFPTPTIFKTTLLNHNFIGLDTATTYFVRVRAITTGGTDGDFSGTLNTTTGQVESADIADGSITAAALGGGLVANSAAVSSSTDILFDENDGETQLITLAITPFSSGNSIAIIVSATIDNPSGAGVNLVTFKVRRGIGGPEIYSETTGYSENNNAASNTAQGPLSIAFVGLDSPATDASITYELTAISTSSVAASDATALAYGLILLEVTS